MKKLLLPLIPLSLLFAGSSMVDVADAASARRQPNGAIRFYDDNGFDRGYLWCLRRGGGFGGGAFGFGGQPDCSYYTLQQCRASMIGLSGDCIQNPWAAYVTPPPRARRKAR